MTVKALKDFRDRDEIGHLLRLVAIDVRRVELPRGAHDRIVERLQSLLVQPAIAGALAKWLDSGDSGVREPLRAELARLLVLEGVDSDVVADLVVASIGRNLPLAKRTDREASHLDAELTRELVHKLIRQFEDFVPPDGARAGRPAGAGAGELPDRMHIAASAGVVLDLRTGDPRRDRADWGAAWDKDRTIPAGRIIELLTQAGTDNRNPRRLHIRGARIAGAVDLAGMTALCPVVLEDCYFEAHVGLREAKLPGLRLSGSKLSRGLDGWGMMIDAALELNRDFIALDAVRLDWARVGGWVDCVGGYFAGRAEIALSANGLQVGGDVLCGEDRAAVSDPLVAMYDNAQEAVGRRFEAWGQVRLARAHIGGQLYCTGGRFMNRGRIALFADSIKVDGRVTCGPGFLAEGQVNFRRADVGGQLRFEGVTSKPPNAKSLPAGSVPEKQAEEIAWHIEAAHIGRALSFKPSRPVEGVVNLINAKLGYLNDNKHSWTPGRYAMFGLRFGQLAGPWEQREDGSWREQGEYRDWLRRDEAVTYRLKWLKDERDGYQPQLYDQLAENYRRVGHEAAERRVLIAKQERRRRNLPLPAKAWNWVSFLLLGYGYRVWQALILFLLLLGGGTAFFEAYGHPVTQHDHSQYPPHYAPWIYTLDLLLPVINLGERENWIAKSGAPQIVATFLIIAGWVLATTFLAGLSGLVRRTNE